MTSSPQEAPAPHRFYKRANGSRLAYAQYPGGDDRLSGPCAIWLGGLRSDMTGGKALALHAWAEKREAAFLRFDYRGHGASDGAFADFVLSDWLDDALTMIDAKTEGPLILFGSSMGAWLALHCALRLSERIAGLGLIAPAADFTERLMRPSLTEAQSAALQSQGYFDEPSEYDETPMRITQRLLEDGAGLSLLDQPLHIQAPVRILQGMRDEAVPWRHAALIAETLSGPDVTLTLSKDGDHRLSDPANLQRLIAMADELFERAGRLAPPAAQTA